MNNPNYQQFLGYDGNGDGIQDLQPPSGHGGGNTRQNFHENVTQPSVDYNQNTEYSRTNVRQFGNERMPSVAFSHMFQNEKSSVHNQPKRQQPIIRNQQVSPNIQSSLNVPSVPSRVMNSSGMRPSIPRVESQMRYCPGYSEIPKYDPFEEVKTKGIEQSLENDFFLADDIHGMMLPGNERMNIVIWGFPNDGKESLLMTLVSNENNIQRNVRRQSDRMCIFNLRNRVSIIVPWDYNPGMYDSNNDRTTASKKDMRNEGKIEYQAFKNIVEGRISNGEMKKDVLHNIRNSIQFQRGNPELAATCVLFCVDSNRFSKDVNLLKAFVAFCKKSRIKHFLVMTKTDIVINDSVRNTNSPKFDNILKYGQKKLSHAKQLTTSETNWCAYRDSFIKEIGGNINTYPMICYQILKSNYANRLVFHLTRDLLHAIFNRNIEEEKKKKEFYLDIFKGETPKQIEYSLSKKLNSSSWKRIGNHLKSTFYDEVIKKPEIVDYMRNPNEENMSSFSAIKKDHGLINLNILMDVYYKYLHFAVSSREVLHARFFIVENTSIRNSRIMGVLFPRDYVYPLANTYVEKQPSGGTFIPKVRSGGFVSDSNIMSMASTGFDIFAPEDPKDEIEDPGEEEEEEEEDKPLRSCVYFETEIRDPKLIEEIDREWNKENQETLQSADFEFIDIIESREPQSAQTFTFSETRYLRLLFGTNEYWLTRTNYLNIHKKIEEFIQKEKKNESIKKELADMKKTHEKFEKRFNDFQKQVLEHIQKFADDESDLTN